MGRVVQDSLLCPGEKIHTCVKLTQKYEMEEEALPLEQQAGYVDRHLQRPTLQEAMQEYLKMT
jgi:hypothetical protein